MINSRLFLKRLCACLILAALLLPCPIPGADTAYADMTCVYCDGRGEVRCGNCSGYDRTCYACHGRGYVTCGYCRGTGRLGAKLGGDTPSDPGGGGSGGGGGSQQPPAMSLSDTALKVTVGHSYTLQLKNASGTVTWKSSKPTVAAVTSGGKVTGKAVGKATITASCAGKKFTCAVTVTAQVKAKSVVFGKNTVTVPNHGTQALKYTVSPDPDTLTEPYTLKWVSSDTKVATVSKTGVVTAKKAGTAKVTLQLKVNGKVVDKDVCTVKVKAVSAKSVTLGKKAVTVLNGHTQALRYTVSPAENKLTEPYTLKWISSNTKVAAVDQNGVVTAKKAGTAKVTLQLKVNGKVVNKAVCTVKVKSIWAKTVTLNNAEQTLREGKTLTLYPVISPDENTLTEPFSLKWTSDAPGIAAVDGSGLVTGIRPGAAVITVKLIVKGKAVSTARCTIRVQSSQTQLLEKFRQIASDQGGTLTYTSGILTVTYSSSSGAFTFKKDEGYTSVTLTMPRNFSGSGRLDYMYTSRFGGSLSVKATAQVGLTAIRHNAGYDWTFTSGDGYGDLANTSVNVLMDLIGGFLKDQMGWSLRDIGIPNY